MELVGLSYIGLNAVVDFLYSGELLLDGGNIVYVLEAAHLLQVRCYAFPDFYIFYNGSNKKCDVAHAFIYQCLDCIVEVYFELVGCFFFIFFFSFSETLDLKLVNTILHLSNM